MKAIEDLRERSWVSVSVQWELDWGDPQEWENVLCTTIYIKQKRLHMIATSCRQLWSENEERHLPVFGW